MSVEIERKFLVQSDEWVDDMRSCHTIAQGYISNQPNATVRVRIINEAAAWLTIKGNRSNLTCMEMEYQIPVEDGHKLIALSNFAPITKIRHIVIDEWEQRWEVDQFYVDTELKLTLAEIELSAEDQHVELPSWVGEEVSTDPKYLNVNIANWITQDNNGTEQSQ